LAKRKTAGVRGVSPVGGQVERSYGRKDCFQGRMIVFLWRK